jgi:hypothetical protein
MLTEDNHQGPPSEYSGADGFLGPLFSEGKATKSMCSDHAAPDEEEDQNEAY